jgi:hypothetical protein
MKLKTYAKVKCMTTAHRPEEKWEYAIVRYVYHT